MERADLAELHFITPISNLPSIARSGIVCNHRSQALGAASIAKAEVQARRALKRVPNGLMLHEYANLYLNARNPMMYLRSALHESTCVLSVDTGVLDIPGVVISDQNAASDWVRFAPAPDGLAIVNAALTFAEYWTHPGDPKAEWRHKSAMCAEVLVPGVVPTKFIKGAYISCGVAEQAVQRLGLGMSTAINSRLFFR